MKSLLLPLLLIAVAGCQSSQSRHVSSDTQATPPPRLTAAAAQRLETLVGHEVRVQFRRDALGINATAPVSPTVERVGPRPVYLDGTLTAVTDDWIAIQTDKVIHWIPREGVLLIEISR